MKKDKNKKTISSLKKDNKLDTKNLSKNEENQLLLSTLKEQKDKNEIVEEGKQETRRTYICSCGCKVTLEGETYKRKIKDGFELCSKCI